MVDVPDTNMESKEALEYWGFLFEKDRNKCASDKLDRLLRGIARCISNNFARHDSNDLTPSQLAAFYRSVGGNYDPFFLSMPSQSIAFIYKSIGCLHSLQPIPADNGYSSPSIPALKARGFVTWQTIQLLLGPEEHVPFIQNALRTFNVVDPQNGKPFPKLLPKEAFPSQPDEHMVAWHGGISERLRIEAQAVEHVDAHNRSSANMSTDDSAEERADAAKYFSNPFYRNHDGRAAIVRHITNAPARVMEGGKIVARTIQNIADPHLWSPSHYSQPVSPHRQVRRHRSHDPPPSPRQYCTGWDEGKVHDILKPHQQPRSTTNRVGQGPLHGRSPNSSSGGHDRTSEQYARGPSVLSATSRYDFTTGVQNPALQKDLAPVNGVRGRRYPNEKPWR